LAGVSGDSRAEGSPEMLRASCPYNYCRKHHETVIT